MWNVMEVYINYYLFRKNDFGKDFQEIHGPMNLRLSWKLQETR